MPITLVLISNSGILFSDHVSSARLARLSLLQSPVEAFLGFINNDIEKKSVVYIASTLRERMLLWKRKAQYGAISKKRKPLR